MWCVWFTPKNKILYLFFPVKNFYNIIVKKKKEIADNYYKRRSYFKKTLEDTDIIVILN